MDEIESVYPREGDYRCISLRLRESRQLYNSLDPAPFHERDLDADAAAYLFDSARELRSVAQVKIVLWLTENLTSELAQTLGQSIRNYFRYRAGRLRQQRQHLLQVGQRSLLIGICFLAVCQSVAVTAFKGDALWTTVLREGLTILGWVAMWRPVEIFLYEWWPILEQQRTCERIAGLDIEVRPEAQAKVANSADG